MLLYLMYLANRRDTVSTTISLYPLQVCVNYIIFIKNDHMLDKCDSQPESTSQCGAHG